ncbi:MAG TPA: DNA integrity scanning protein DisA [Deltaproteobacteria bacterium]|nr:DNA integrity scanning protein DisA [Deltaproteobacteria bacterium]
MGSDFLSILRFLAPGTKLRKALDDIARAKLGSMLFFVHSAKEFEHLIQDGFYFNAEFTPEKLYELSKMDGAIILDEGISRIFAANTQLMPDTSIPTTETGMRHRTAERLAKQTGRLVVTVSSRSNVITIYHNRIKYPLYNTNFLISKINQSLTVLKQCKENLDKRITHFEIQELNDTVKLIDITHLISSFLETYRICEDIIPNIIEIGEEGKLADMRLQEIVRDLEEQLRFLFMDYGMENATVHWTDESNRFFENLKDTGPIVIARILGYDVSSVSQMEETEVVPKGFRLLIVKSKIPMSIAVKVVDEFENVHGIRCAGIETLKEVDGIGTKRANAIIESIEHLKGGA